MLRLDVLREDVARHLAEIKAEIFNLLAVGHRQVGSDANQQLMQHQPPRAKCYDLAHFKAGEIMEFGRLGEIREDIRGQKNRAVLP